MLAILVFVLFVLGLLLYFAPLQSSRRLAKNVLEDLRPDLPEDPQENSKIYGFRKGEQKSNTRYALSKAVILGFETNADYLKFLRLNRLMPLIFALIILALGAFFISSLKFASMLVLCVMGMSLGYLIARRQLRARTEFSKSRIEFFLPMAMERLVMAVQAGLDLLPAIKSVTELKQNKNKVFEYDPILALLRHVYQLTEAGLGFEQALKDVADQIEVPALKHAFVYLGLAHREGGELVGPLRELSDATQIYYQESVDESIAKMPVKATLPLVLTFMGLILCFITIPIAQLGTMFGHAKVTFKE